MIAKALLIATLIVATEPNPGPNATATNLFVLRLTTAIKLMTSFSMVNTVTLGCSARFPELIDQGKQAAAAWQARTPLGMEDALAVMRRLYEDQGKTEPELSRQIDRMRKADVLSTIIPNMDQNMCASLIRQTNDGAFDMKASELQTIRDYLHSQK